MATHGGGGTPTDTAWADAATGWTGPGDTVVVDKNAHTVTIHKGRPTSTPIIGPGGAVDPSNWFQYGWLSPFYWGSGVNPATEPGIHATPATPTQPQGGADWNTPSLPSLPSLPAMLPGPSGGLSALFGSPWIILGAVALVLILLLRR